MRKRERREGREEGRKEGRLLTWPWSGVISTSQGPCIEILTPLFANLFVSDKLLYFLYFIFLICKMGQY